MMIKDTPSISVVMPVYDTREDWLRRSVESILDQTWSDLEFLTVLDAPTDGSEEIIREYAQSDPRIRILLNEENQGITSSLNRGLRQARGELIARMDSDDIAGKDRLEKQRAFLQEKDLDLAGTRVQNVDSEGHPAGTPSPREPEEEIGRMLDHINCFYHSTWMFRRSLAEKLGGYRRITACEDYDFLLRALEEGARIGICEEVLLEYRINDRGISRKNDLEQFLASVYLQDHRHRINEIEEWEVEAFVRERAAKYNRKRFDRATEYIEEGMRRAGQGRTLSGGLCWLKAGIISRPARRRIRNYYGAHRLRQTDHAGSGGGDE